MIIHRNLKLSTIRKEIYNINYEKKFEAQLDELTSNRINKNLMIKRLKSAEKPEIYRNDNKQSLRVTNPENKISVNAYSKFYIY